MRKLKKRDYEFASFESKNPTGPYWRIARDMHESSAWKVLSCYAKVVYCEMKYKYNKNNANDISLTYSEAKEKLKMDPRTFTKTIDLLLECGFIKIIKQGWHKADPTIYGFSNQWKYYGTSVIQPSRRVKRCSKAKDTS